MGQNHKDMDVFKILGKIRYKITKVRQKEGKYVYWLQAQH